MHLWTLRPRGDYGIASDSGVVGAGELLPWWVGTLSLIVVLAGPSSLNES